jgi:hypothetical protein
MQRAISSRRQRLELRRIARELRGQDPELARLLSRRGSLLPPLRLTTLPTVAYAVIAAVLLGSGLILGVASAVWSGLVMGGLALLRRRVGGRAVRPPGSNLGSPPTSRSDR